MDTGIIPYSPEWFEIRRGSFTGSEAFKLMIEPRSKSAKENGDLSEGTETYVLEKVWESLSGQTKAGFDNIATEWGVEQEPFAKKWYSKITGNVVMDATLCKKEGIDMLVTPDGYVGEDGLIEIKCPFNGSNHLKHCFVSDQDCFKENNKEYYWQIQAQLLVTGRKWCDFVSFDPRIDSKLGLFIYRVLPNAEDMEKLLSQIKKCRKVYESYLQTFKPIEA